MLIYKEHNYMLLILDNDFRWWTGVAAENTEFSRKRSTSAILGNIWILDYLVFEFD